MFYQLSFDHTNAFKYIWIIFNNNKLWKIRNQTANQEIHNLLGLMEKEKCFVPMFVNGCQTCYSCLVLSANILFC